MRLDETRVILTADKGAALVILGKAAYINKAEKLLDEGETCKKIVTDSTNRYKNKLINLLTKFRVEGGLNDTPFKKMYLTGACAPTSYRLPKIHERPSTPIVYSRSTTTYLSGKGAGQGPETTGKQIPYHV